MSVSCLLGNCSSLLSLLLSGLYGKILEYHRLTCLNSMDDSMLRFTSIKAEYSLPSSFQIWNWGISLSMVLWVHDDEYFFFFFAKGLVELHLLRFRKKKSATKHDFHRPDRIILILLLLSRHPLEVFARKETGTRDFLWRLVCGD